MENFNITRFFKTLANSKLYIFITMVLFIFVGYFYSFYYVTPMYESSATVVLTQNDKVDLTQEAITGQDITLNQNLLSTYTKLTKSDRVLEQVIKNLKLNMSLQELSGLITVQPMNNTQVFKISVRSNNNEIAAEIANEVVKVFSKEVQDLYNMNNVYIMDLAEVTNTAYNVNHIKDIIMFALAGLFTSLVMVVIIYLLDTTIKSEQDIEGYAKISVLSTIPVYQNEENKKASELIVNEKPKDPVSECFKTFRTNIMFSAQNKELKTILVTSSSMGEGKSFVSSNLAVTFAQSGKRVILLDTDMRKGRIHKIFNITNKHGLSNCLSDIGENGELVNINWYIQKSKIPNLHIMTSGIVPPNPSELLSSSNMKKFLEALKTQYDIIICDGTPCMLVSDSIALSKIVDATIIVTANKLTKIDSLVKVKKSIEIVGGNISGAVINKMEVSAKEYKNSYYYGEHNVKSKELETEIIEDENILENNLCINNQDEDIETLDENIETYNIECNNKELERKDNFNELTTIINNNTKEVLELKEIYKDVMQGSIDAMFRKDKTGTILEEVENMKKLYEENANLQNENIEDKFTEQSDNMLYALNNIKYTYENALNEQNQSIIKLEESLTNSVDDKFNEQSSNLLEELENIKQKYENTIKAQRESIVALEKNITSRVDNKFGEQSDNMLEELENIKQIYEDTMKAQSESITELEKKITDNVDTKFTKQAKSIVNGLINIKGIYEDTMKAQSENITELEKKITNNVDNKFSEQSSNLLEELENIKQTYENTMNMQSENMTELEKKITNNVDTKFTKQAKSIVNGLINIKGIYENTMKAQQESIIELEKKITNNVDNKFLEQQNSILDELANIKETYENAINEQSENIKTLEEKITDNVENKFDEQSSSILNELDDVKQRYEEAINEQNENITALEEKISNMNLDEKFSEQSSNILNELDNVKQRYEEAIKEQKESITALEEKIANINFNEQSNNILNELNKVKASYEQAINIQNKQIETLDNKISNVNNYEVLAAINGLYRQLYDMGERFTYLERKAIDNENLIKSVNLAGYGYYRQDRVADFKKSDEKIKGKLDEKVVRIQDYLENNYNNNVSSSATILNEVNVVNSKKNTKIANSNAEKENISTTKNTQKTTTILGEQIEDKFKDTRKNSTILEEQIKNTNKNMQKEVINSVVENKNIQVKVVNSEEINTQNKIANNAQIKKDNTSVLRSINDINKANVGKKVEFIDYSKIKNTQKRGFFNFNRTEEEEPVAIVSQILCGNKESVG